MLVHYFGKSLNLASILVVSIDVLSRVLVYPHMSRSIPQLTPLGTTHCPRLLFWLQAWQVVCASISFLLTATLCRHKHLLLVNWWKRNNDDGLGEPYKGIAMF